MSCSRIDTNQFQSTPSARRATLNSIGCAIDGVDFNPRPPRGGRHNDFGVLIFQVVFQSTPSARRATESLENSLVSARISIHALREEGDSPPDDVEMLPEISIHALREEGDATVHFRC